MKRRRRRDCQKFVRLYFFFCKKLFRMAYLEKFVTNKKAIFWEFFFFFTLELMIESLACTIEVWIKLGLEELFLFAKKTHLRGLLRVLALINWKMELFAPNSIGFRSGYYMPGFFCFFFIGHDIAGVCGFYNFFLWISMIISVHRNLKFCHGGIVLQLVLIILQRGGRWRFFQKKKKGNTWSWLFHFPIIIIFRHASSSDFFLYFSMLMVLPMYPFFFFWTLATTYGLLRVHIDVILFVCCTYRCCLFRYDFATCLLLFFFSSFPFLVTYLQLLSESWCLCTLYVAVICQIMAPKGKKINQLYIPARTPMRHYSQKRTTEAHFD